MLTSDERGRWDRDGALTIPGLMSAADRHDLIGWSESIRTWRPRGGDDNPPIHRSQDGAVSLVENVAAHHGGIDDLVRQSLIMEVAAALLGEPVVLHSDAIRFGPDTVASPGRRPMFRSHYVDRHVICVVALVDVATGLFDIASGCHRQRLDVDAEGELAAVAASTLLWSRVTLAAGDTLWLHRQTPVRSALGVPPAQEPVRTLELVYGARIQGDLRAAHYNKQRRRLSSLCSDLADGEAMKGS